MLVSFTDDNNIYDHCTSEMYWSVSDYFAVLKNSLITVKENVEFIAFMTTVYSYAAYICAWLGMFSKGKCAASVIEYYRIVYIVLWVDNFLTWATLSDIVLID